MNKEALFKAQGSCKKSQIFVSVYKISCSNVLLHALFCKALFVTLQTCFNKNDCWGRCTTTVNSTASQRRATQCLTLDA